MWFFSSVRFTNPKFLHRTFAYLYNSIPSFSNREFLLITFESFSRLIGEPWAKAVNAIKATIPRVNARSIFCLTQQCSVVVPVARLVHALRLIYIYTRAHTSNIIRETTDSVMTFYKLVVLFFYAINIDRDLWVLKWLITAFISTTLNQKLLQKWQSLLKKVTITTI